MVCRRSAHLACPRSSAVSELAQRKTRAQLDFEMRRWSRFVCPPDCGRSRQLMPNSLPLGVLHPHCVVIEAVGAQGSGDRGPETGQAPGLGVNSLLADLERNVPDAARVRAVGAGVDVEVEAVLDHLGVRHHMEPDARAVTAGIDDAVRADSQLTVGKPDVAPPGVPGSEPFGGRFKHVSQGSRPEAGKQLGVLAVDDKLESGRHRAPIGSAVARALASMPPAKAG